MKRFDLCSLKFGVESLDDKLGILLFFLSFFVSSQAFLIDFE